eukprot:1160436-Pelagomonas_calceolata.AAC.20
MLCPQVSSGRCTKAFAAQPHAFIAQPHAQLYKSFHCTATCTAVQKLSLHSHMHSCTQAFTAQPHAQMYTSFHCTAACTDVQKLSLHSHMLQHTAHYPSSAVGQCSHYVSSPPLLVNKHILIVQPGLGRL